MYNFNQHTKELQENGYAITDPVFSDAEVKHLKRVIDCDEKTYAIRQLLHKLPEVETLVFGNSNFQKLFETVCSKDFFLTKAMYFNKPKMSNWFVSYHQDISISAAQKITCEGFTQWTHKNGQLGVVPPKKVLEDTITFRIHLDTTDASNGALRVIKGSHQKGVIRVDEHFKSEDYGEEALCKVSRGSVMLMKPLLLHASQKSVSDQDRGVIHLEFCNQEIPMKWLERREVGEYKVESSKLKVYN